MSARTTHSIAHFDSSFMLGGLTAPLPPGDYDVDHDEELIDGISRVAWRRVATFIHLPARGIKACKASLSLSTTLILKPHWSGTGKEQAETATIQMRPSSCRTSTVPMLYAFWLTTFRSAATTSKQVDLCPLSCNVPISVS